MVCKKCKRSTSDFFDKCFYCFTTFNKYTCFNYEEIKYVKSLIEQCKSIKNYIIENNGMFLEEITELKKTLHFFSSLYRKLFKLIFNKSSNEASLDLEQLNRIESRLENILYQLDNGEIIIDSSNERNSYSRYFNPIDQFDDKRIYNPKDILISNIYQVVLYIKDKTKKENFLLFPKFINNDLITDDDSFYTIEQIKDGELMKNPSDKKFFIPIDTFNKFTDKALSKREACIILSELSNKEWKDLIQESGIESKIEEIDVKAKIKSINEKYY